MDILAFLVDTTQDNTEKLPVVDPVKTNVKRKTNLRNISPEYQEQTRSKVVARDEMIKETE